MINLYNKFEKRDQWRKNLSKPWNKNDPSVTSRIISLHFGQPQWPCWKIAKEVGVHRSSIHRIRRDLVKMNEW